MWNEKQKITSYRHYTERSLQLEFWNQNSYSEWERMSGLSPKWLGNVGLKKAMLIHVRSRRCICVLCFALCSALQATYACHSAKWKFTHTCTCIACHSKIFLFLQSNEFKYNKPQFLEKAKEWTQKYATGNKVTAASVKVLLKMF